MENKTVKVYFENGYESINDVKYVCLEFTEETIKVLQSMYKDANNLKYSHLSSFTTYLEGFKFSLSSGIDTTLKDLVSRGTHLVNDFEYMNICKLEMEQIKVESCGNIRFSASEEGVTMISSEFNSSLTLQDLVTALEKGENITLDLHMNAWDLNRVHCESFDWLGVDAC